MKSPWKSSTSLEAGTVTSCANSLPEMGSTKFVRWTIRERTAGHRGPTRSDA
jgi:hypothetical protein